jgi:RNA polymerase sigma-70 factor (ECF subfamily)
MSKAMPENASTSGSDSSATPPRCDASAPAGNNSLHDEGETPSDIDSAPTPPSRFDTDFDRGLVADLLLGNKYAVRLFVERMRPVIATAARRAPLDIRPDAIQDVWLYLWDRNFLVLQKWNRSGPLAHYVMIVAKNRVLDYLRRHQNDLRRQGIEIWLIGDALRCPDELIDRNSPEQQILAFENERCLENAKASLSEKHRELIVLRYDCDLKLREIAQRLGRTIGAVSATLARAERALRDRVLEICGDHLGPVVRGILNGGPSDDKR